MNSLIARLHISLLENVVMNEEGQATTEYALVLLGAALIALLVIGWATTGGGADKVGELFDTVIDSVIGKV